MTDQQATTPTVTGKYHPAALLLPEMSEQEYRELVEDIREHGQRHPIIVDEQGVILDGRHRYRAMTELALEPTMRTFQGDEHAKVALVMSENVHRRHLTVQQRAAIAAELANMAHGTNRYEMKVEGSFDPSTPVAEAKPVMTIAAAANAMRVSEKTVKRAKNIMRTDPEAHAKAKAGTLGKAKPKHIRAKPVDGDAAPKPKSAATIGANLLEAMRQLQLDLSTAHRAMKNGSDWFGQMLPMHQKDLRALAEWLQAHLDDIWTATKPDAPEPVEVAAEPDLTTKNYVNAEKQHDDEWTIRGARIREARKAKGMNGKELAMMANVAPNIVSMCEHAKLSKSGGPAAGRPAYAKLEAALGIAS